MNKEECGKGFAGLFSPFNQRQGAGFCVIPVPFELTTTYGRGTRDGPKAIIEASHNMELYDEDTSSNVSESGIWTMDPVEAKSCGVMIDKVVRATGSALDDKMFPIILGGEHTVSIGGVRAAFQRYPDLTVIQFDAHADLRREYLGERLSHACVMSVINDICPTISYGIRSFSEEEKEDVLRLKSEGRLFGAKELLKSFKPECALRNLTKNVYVTFDVDFFDPSMMPATGTPEPGGPGWYDALDILWRISKKSRIVGADIVELSPIKGLTHPDFACAKLAYTLMSYSCRL